MTDCLKGKAHEWRLVSDKVVCHLCNARGTRTNLDDDVGSFYAVRDERDELQETLEQLRAAYYTETVLSGNLRAERDEGRQWAKAWKRAAKQWYSLARELLGLSMAHSHIADEFLAELNEARERLNELEAERDKWREDCQNQIQAGTNRLDELWRLQNRCRDDVGRCCRDDELDEYKPERWSSTWKRAAKKYYEKWMVQDTLADIGHAAQLVWMERTKKARAEAVQVAKECRELQARIDTIKQCRCETCQKFHSGTYTCSEWAPLRCVVNDYSEWEEKIETVTGTGRVVSVGKRPDLVITR